MSIVWFNGQHALRTVDVTPAYIVLPTGQTHEIVPFAFIDGVNPALQLHKPLLNVAAPEVKAFSTVVQLVDATHVKVPPLLNLY